MAIRKGVKEGSLIVWKKGANKTGKSVLIQLLIPEHADVIRGREQYEPGGKCRASEALVLGIYDIVYNIDANNEYSIKPTKSKIAYPFMQRHKRKYSNGKITYFKYVVGKTVKPCQPFDLSNKICASGIHFYKTIGKALNHH